MTGPSWSRVAELFPTLDKLQPRSVRGFLTPVGHAGSHFAHVLPSGQGRARVSHLSLFLMQVAGSVAAIPTRSRHGRRRSLFPPRPSVSCVSVSLARHPIEYLNGETGHSVRGYSIDPGGNHFHLLDRRVYTKMPRSTALQSTK